MKSPLDELIAIVPKNKREEYRIQLRTWKGIRMIDVRIYVDDGYGEFKPTAKGISIRPAILDSIVSALFQCRNRSVQEGLLGDLAAPNVTPPDREDEPCPNFH